MTIDVSSLTMGTNFPSPKSERFTVPCAIETDIHAFATERTLARAVKLHVQYGRPRDIVHGKFACHARRRGTRPLNLFRHELDPWIILGIEKLVGGQLTVQLSVRGLDLGDGDLRLQSGVRDRR